MKQTKSIIRYILAAACCLLGLAMLTVFTAVRFTGFLLCCAGAALAVYDLLDRWGGRSRAGRVCKGVFLALLAAGLLLFAALEARVVSWARTDRETPVSAVVVFGAGVNGTEPSLSLLTRLEAALDYAEDHPEVPIVVSGAQGRGEEISEARCMADWLAAHGVAAERILLEERATDTRENVRYSIELLAENGVDPAAGIAFVTSDYHLCRAAYLRGGSHTVPVAAHMPARFWPLTVNYFVREAFALAAEMVR